MILGRLAGVQVAGPPDWRRYHVGGKVTVRDEVGELHEFTCNISPVMLPVMEREIRSGGGDLRIWRQHGDELWVTALS